MLSLISDILTLAGGYLSGMEKEQKVHRWNSLSYLTHELGDDEPGQDQKRAWRNETSFRD